jgi:hypothetical protein
MANKTMVSPELRTEIAEARKRAKEAARKEPRATSARYDTDSGRIIVDLTNGCQFAFPAEFVQSLVAASPSDRAEVEVSEGGTALHWESLDEDLGITPLLAGIFGTAAWMKEIGRKGGRSASPAKVAASRANGAKGGRPRKVVDTAGG